MVNLVKISKSEKETHKIAGNLARKVIGSRDPVTIALEGELGAGKTTFIRGFLRSLGVREKVKSPTFVLMRHYKIPKSDKEIYHLDCYRVRDHRDLATLDLRSIFNFQDSIVLIEWPERV